MKLIQFLLSNWYIVVILYIVLRTIARTVKPPAGSPPKAGPGGASKQGMPSFGGGEGGWGRTVKQTVTKTMQKSAANNRQNDQGAALSSQSSQQPQNGAGRGYQSAEGLTSKASSSAAPRRLQSVPAASQAEPAQPTVAPSASQLAQGVIWAEILGPPRAKKPYGK
ncbi:hypothetical protein N0M98_25510 [Paenibacillus doosanensis]|uniref:hypothetical protein n=1 Tax=Paenibacillus doosanensis TaxID=1229154 RepID=UPI00217F6401|nr:hypothetical protein [Paenibacillus doosanensis]MCS7463468.1 hypothetical protein [Paenibacillus doosanensis]